MSVVSAIYHVQTAVIRGNVSTAVLEIEAEVFLAAQWLPAGRAALVSRL